MRSCSSLIRRALRVTRVSLVSRSLLGGSHAGSVVRVCVGPRRGPTRTISFIGRELSTRGVPYRVSLTSYGTRS